MQYRRLGTSGLRVSRICLGAMTFGETTGERTAARIVGHARDAGVNFIDTADIYAYGEGERITGRLVRRQRHRWVIATKVGNAMSEELLQRGISRRWIFRAIDDSLKRLGTDYVDIYYLHRDDRITPLEECLPALADLIRAGKVRYWGFSNFRGWRIAEMVGVCRQLGLPPPVAAQPYYNLLNRMVEVDYLPACAHFGIGVVPYSALARGVLTGKYRTGLRPPPASRAARKDVRFMQTENRAESFAIAEKIGKRAAALGMTPGQFALNWVLNASAVDSVLAGPRTLRQWREYVGALDRPFTAEDERFVDGLVPPGHPSTPGFTDPAYPVAGRMPRVG
jgi:aryl-alcohol dehydrogenase (NADP+)